MKNPLLTLFRHCALRSLKGGAATGLLPLGQFRSALVIVDAAEGEEAVAKVSRSVRQFFEYQGIPVQIAAPSRKELDLIGRPKRKLRGALAAGADLLVCLDASPDGFCLTVVTIQPDGFTAEYLSRTVPARFKVGCRVLEGNVYDLVVAPPEGGAGGQAAAFAAIRDILVKIR